MKKTDLITIAKDFNKVLGLDPPIETNSSIKQELLEEKILEAAPLLEIGDKLEEDAVRFLQQFLKPHLPNYDQKVLAVMTKLGITEEEEVEEVAEEEEEEAPVADAEEIEDAQEVEEEEETLKTQVKDAQTLKQLKELAKAYDEFKSIRGTLTKYKTAKDLKQALIEFMQTPEEEPKKEKEPKQPSQKKATKKAPKKSRMVVVCDTLKTLPKKGMDINSFCEKADKNYEGGSNVKQTKHLLKVILPTLLEFDVVKFEQNVLFIIE